MKQLRKVSRRSFLATVAGATGGIMLTASSDVEATVLQGCTDRDPSPPRGDAGGQGRNCQGRQTGCSDSDSGSGADPGGQGRNCTPGQQTGCSDSDSGSASDPGGQGRNCQSTGCSDSDRGSSADPGGQGRNCGGQPQTGCSDNDPSDPSGRGRNCGGRPDGQETGRRERRYEICWVDHPSRSNDECNIQTYTEWQTTYTDGRTIIDNADAQRRQAEMRNRGYQERWRRSIVNDW